jgi:hypothetical protein
LRVLIACEFSGTVREAFRRRGHDAWSCDLLETEQPSPYHVVGNVLDVLWGHPDGAQWDLLIAHPPCQYLTNAGSRWLYDGGKGKVRNQQRWWSMIAAADFMRSMQLAPVPRIAVENPIMHRYGRAVVGAPTQIIQPWMFGHGETKATCLGLQNLPPLVPTQIVDGRAPRVHHESPGPDRWKNRSRTLHGIGEAMAEQWGSLNQAERIDVASGF